MKTNKKLRGWTYLEVKQHSRDALHESPVGYIDEFSWQEKMNLIEFLFDQVQIYRVLESSLPSLSVHQRRAVLHQMDRIKTLVTELT